MPQEIPLSELAEVAVQRAAHLLRADVGAKNCMPDQFGNNFYMLFVARRAPDKVPHLVTTYLKIAESFGEPWQRFLSDNADLLAEMDKVLSDEEIYSDILRLFRSFYRIRDFDGGDAFDVRIHPELGIHAIGIPIWNRLNSLLERAAERMRVAGLDPEQFYG